MPSLYGLILIAAGLTMILVGLHGAKGLELARPTLAAAPATVGSSGQSGFSPASGAGQGAGGGSGGSW